MSSGIALIIIVAILAAPASAIVGFLAGVLIRDRIARSLPAVPPLPRPLIRRSERKAADEKAKQTGTRIPT